MTLYLENCAKTTYNQVRLAAVLRRGTNVRLLSPDPHAGRGRADLTDRGYSLFPMTCAE